MLSKPVQEAEQLGHIGNLRPYSQGGLKLRREPRQLRTRRQPFRDQDRCGLPVRESPEQPRLSNSPASEQVQRIAIWAGPPMLERHEVSLAVDKSVEGRKDVGHRIC